jgi:hypothetical protein
VILSHPIKAAAGILAARHLFRNNTGSFATLAAIRRAGAVF